MKLYECFIYKRTSRLSQVRWPQYRGVSTFFISVSVFGSLGLPRQVGLQTDYFSLNQPGGQLVLKFCKESMGCR